MKSIFEKFYGKSSFIIHCRHSQSSVCVYVQVMKLSPHSYRAGAKFERSRGDD